MVVRAGEWSTHGLPFGTGKPTGEGLVHRPVSSECQHYLAIVTNSSAKRQRPPLYFGSGLSRVTKRIHTKHRSCY